MAKAGDERSNEQLKGLAQDYLINNGYTYRFSTMSWQQNGMGVTAKHVQGMLAYDLSASTTRIGVVMVAILAEETAAAIERSKDWVMKIEGHVLRLGDKRQAALKDMLRLMQRAGTTPQMHEAHVIMLSQWLWQVKRHIMGLIVINHVAPVLWSREQGSGKSALVNRICDPLNDYTRRMAVNDLQRSFSGPLLSQARIIQFDEFANASRADANVLKGILTGVDFNEREIYSGSGFSGANRLSCIGTSNLRPPHGFVDETGGRRFWPIHVDESRPTAVNAKGVGLNLIDMTMLWACVSVEDESPYSMASPAMRAFIDHTQDVHVRTHTSLSQYIAEALEPCRGQVVYFGPLRKQYKAYCTQNGMTAVSGGQPIFAHHLEDLGLTVKHPQNKWRVENYIMRSDALIIP